LFFLFSCNYTKNLSKNEYALIKNTVKVEGVKGTLFDELIDLIRPIPNKKFMDMFPIKVSLWAYHQPKFDSIKGITKDSKFNRWCRKVGEPPTLLDTTDMLHSISQIKLAMFKRGYFDATVQKEIQYLKKQKARVNYFVSPKQSYCIRKVDYQIDIPDYKRIIITDTVNSLVKKGMIYDEDILIAERNRIVNIIKDQGYFHITSNIVTFLVDTNDAYHHINTQSHPTLNLTVKVSFDDVEDKSLVSKNTNRYKFNNALIYTNYDLNFDKSVYLDTIPYLDFRNKNDSTLYEFVTIKKLKKGSNRLKLIKDYTSRTIAGSIWMKKGELFTQTAYERTYKKLRDLNNFTIINISYSEDEALWDSISKIGILNTTLRLTRAKQHGLGAAFDIRTDRTSLELSYTNKNIFRGAEYLKISGYGSLYYYNWLNEILKKISTDYPIYLEVGGSVSLLFPRLLMLPQYQNIDFWGYSTEMKFSASYTQRFTRLNLQASYSYNWSPSRYLTHSISPIDISTLDTRSNRDTTIVKKYPESYQRKIEKFFLPSSRYTLSYYKPEKNGNIFRVNFSFETVGLMLFSVNKVVDKDNMWTIFNNFNYGTYEKFELNLVHSKIINKNNSFATRLIFGMAIPFQKNTVVPFERSFFVGGSNSMRGWAFRQLGPGGYNSEEYIERVGDMRMELNLEYRGTIYKAVKFGVFSDIGNVWLLSKYKDMPNAEFSFKTFYKQIAVCVGLGLRLDFNFFILRLDYGLPIYNPSMPIGNYWINNNWFKKNKWWNGTQGIQFGIGYAFY
jgi:outer membrane protein assembly factor BamA